MLDAYWLEIPESSVDGVVPELVCDSVEISGDVVRDVLVTAEAGRVIAGSTRDTRLMHISQRYTLPDSIP